MVRKCVVCDTIIPISEKECPNCGWRYEQDKSHLYQDGNSLNKRNKYKISKKNYINKVVEKPIFRNPTNQIGANVRAQLVIKIILFILCMYLVVFIISFFIRGISALF